jgi:hypothetical protein
MQTDAKGTGCEPKHGTLVDSNPGGVTGGPPAPTPGPPDPKEPKKPKDKDKATQQQQCEQWTMVNKGLQKLSALQGLGCLVPGGQAFCASGGITLVIDVFVIDPITDSACGK